VGGSPQSVVRTAYYGLRLMLAIIGGPPQRFAPYLDLYRRAAAEFGTTAHPVGMHSPGFIADTDEQAREVFWPPYRVLRDRIGATRGWPPISREDYDREVENGSLYIGSPETVAHKIAHAVSDLGVGRTPWDISRLVHDFALSSCTEQRSSPRSARSSADKSDGHGKNMNSTDIHVVGILGAGRHDRPRPRHDVCARRAGCRQYSAARPRRQRRTRRCRNGSPALTSS
jgi:Luciferase-like monooxygenase